MASIGDVFKEETKKAGARPTRATKWIHYSKIKDNQNQYRCGSTEEERQQYRKQVEDLAMLITASGTVLQNLLVKKIGTDEYEMIAGHHRRDACKKLVEEDGLEDYALLPCNIENVSEAREEFDLYATNIFPEKSEYEKMHELERMKYLIETYPEEFPDLQKGRMVDRLATQMNMSKTTVGEYLTISKNLEEEGKKQFRSGELKKSAAVELASLGQEEQKELLKKGTTSLREIRTYKKEKVKEPDAGTVPEPLETMPEERGWPKPEERTARQDIQLEKKEKMQPETTDLDDQANRSDRKAPAESSEETVIKTGEKDGPKELRTAMECETFLNGYKNWEIWCKNRYTEEIFYRQELTDGTAVIVKAFPYTDEFQQEREGTKIYLFKPEMKHLKDAESSRLEVIQYLKNTGK